MGGILYYCTQCGFNHNSDLFKEYRICQLCYRKLFSNSSPENFEYFDSVKSHVHYIWAYRNMARNLMLDAKVNSSQKAIKTIINLSLHSKNLKELIKISEFVLPCPSSLWSRLRGRLDIAGALAYEISKKSGLKLLAPPNHISFRFKKRAKLKEKHILSNGLVEDVGRIPSGLSENENKSILVVDDIFTTGHTMGQVANCFPNFQKYFFSIAKS